jgi:sulfur carrier protein
MSDTIKINGEDRTIAASTVIELLAAEQVDSAAKFVAVAINGSVVPRRSWPDAQIKPGDDIEIVSPAPGG